MSKRKTLLLILFLWIIFCIPLFSNQIYSYSPDLMFHLNRLVGINDSWNSGQLIPRIYPLTNNGYGYISPLFYCDLFLYPFAFLYRLGIPLVICYKVMMGFYTLIGTVIACVCFDRIFTNNKTTSVILVLFCLGQYRLIDCYSRQAFGEFLALQFCPLVILSIYRLLVNKKNNWMQLSISFSLLLLSHNISFVLFCLFFGILLIINFIKERNNKAELIRVIMSTIKAMLLAISLCAWFIFPMIEQLLSNNLWIESYGKMYDISKSCTDIKTLLLPLLTLDYVWFIEVWDVNPLGYVLLFLSLYSLFIKVDTNIKIINYLSFLFLLFAIGLIPLYKIPVFNFLQFSFRWYVLIYPLMVITAGYTISKVDNKYLIILCMVYTILVAINYDYQILKNTNYQINNNELATSIFDINKACKDYNEIEICGAEYLPISVINDYIDDPKSIIGTTIYDPIEIVEISDYELYKSGIKFETNYNQEVGYILPKSYYRGYKLHNIKKDEKINVPIFCVKDFMKIGFVAEPGNNTYELVYEGTIIQKVSLTISLFTFIGSIFIGLTKYGKEKSIIC